MPWVCHQCTYENTAEVVSCAICRALKNAEIRHEPPPPSPPTPPEQADVPTQEAWNCSACTYLNSKSSHSCSVCGSQQTMNNPNGNPSLPSVLSSSPGIDELRDIARASNNNNNNNNLVTNPSSLNLMTRSQSDQPNHGKPKPPKSFIERSQEQSRIGSEKLKKSSKEEAKESWNLLKKILFRIVTQPANLKYISSLITLI